MGGGGLRRGAAFALTDRVANATDVIEITAGAIVLIANPAGQVAVLAAAVVALLVAKVTGPAAIVVVFFAIPISIGCAAAGVVGYTVCVSSGGDFSVASVVRAAWGGGGGAEGSHGEGGGRMGGP